MERNIKVFRAHRALSWLYVIAIALIVFMLMTLEEARTGAVIGPLLLMLAMFLVHHFTAQGAREGKDGARIASIIIGCLMLLGFPLGTIIGIYLLWNTIPGWEPEPA